MFVACVGGQTDGRADGQVDEVKELSPIYF